ncbi:MAG: excinuclease ABC subunit UvrB [Deltaproteobacteria bacterium]|nr:excinuclease ABC subunit UvrB [Deltaproteobacteria bacterium]
MREAKPFRLVAPFEPQGDQPRAIDELVRAAEAGAREQVLLGVTGSGKTFTMANVIARTGRPTLVISPNKTLAAQLYQEFREFFPDNAVEFFVSYYDYYQPEAYIPHTDTYIEKDTSVNEEIDRMRHSATHSLLTRVDVIIVASVSCIYGLGDVDAYNGMIVYAEEGVDLARQGMLARLVEMQYTRNDTDFFRGTFRVRGDVVDIFPPYEEATAVRITFFGDTVDAVHLLDPLRGQPVARPGRVTIFPASHYVTVEEQRKRAIVSIQDELRGRLQDLKGQMKFVEAQRLEQRTMYDLEMIEQMGFCTGIENYSRHLTGRAPGHPPPTLVDYFPKDYLLFVDESHLTIPQINGMFNGDRSRKETLVEYGFRLPSALDNRPLRFEEFDARVRQAVYVSATPGEFEVGRARGVLVEQVIRPTGLQDPAVEVRPAANQVDDLLGEVRRRVAAGDRVLITTLTKRFAEDLAEHLQEKGLKVRYLHSDIDTLERVEILRDLRLGTFDVLVGINLLREGLDLPEVSLVAILDADKEGFLRSARSLIQTIGRASRNVDGSVIMYADRRTASMDKALAETERRRRLQAEFNEAHGITPRTVVKNIGDPKFRVYEADYYTVPIAADAGTSYVSGKDMQDLVEELKKQMFAAARGLEFEKAAELRDRIREIEEVDMGLRAPGEVQALEVTAGGQARRAARRRRRW